MGRRFLEIADRVVSIGRWKYLLTACIAVYVWYFTRLSLDVHRGLGTSAYDLGLYDQGIWLLSRFEAPFVTLMGRNLLGDHASLILLLVVPLYWLFPAVGTLLATQTVVIALGAVPVFLVARRRLGSDAMAFVFAGAYLLHPAVGWTNRENYHPDSFLGVLVGMALYGAIERRWRVYAVFVVLALLVKEDVALVVIPLGIWVAMRRDTRRGLATVVGALAAMLLGMFVLMRSLIGVPTRNAWRIPFGGPTGLVREVIERPGNVIDHFRSDDRPFYAWQMWFPVAFAFLRRPGIALVGAVVVGTNMLSTYWYQYQIEYHYSLIIVPTAVIGAVMGAAALPLRWKRRAVAAVAVTSVWSSLMWGAVPLGAVLNPGATDPIGRDLPYYWPADHPVAVAAREIMAAVPSDASVAAHHALTPHLSRRREIYQFPNPFRVVLYGPDTSLERARACLEAADTLEYVLLPSVVPPDLAPDWERVAGDFEVAASNQLWVLYHRRANTVTCEGGTLVSRP